jgi:transcriptional regulator with XRE-family HTH domain
MSNEHGIRLKEVREGEGLTLAEFGKRLGREGGTISGIENGGPLSPKLAAKIEDEFGVSKDWLLKGTGEKTVTKGDSDLMVVLAKIEDRWRQQVEMLNARLASQDETIKTQAKTITFLTERLLKLEATEQPLDNGPKTIKMPVFEQSEIRDIELKLAA